MKRNNKLKILRKKRKDDQENNAKQQTYERVGSSVHPDHIYIYIYIYIYIHIYIYIYIYTSWAPWGHAGPRGGTSGGARSTRVSLLLSLLLFVVVVVLVLLWSLALFVVVVVVVVVFVTCYIIALHPVSITRFPSFRTQPLESLSHYLWQKQISEQPSPWRKVTEEI